MREDQIDFLNELQDKVKDFQEFVNRVGRSGGTTNSAEPLLNDVRKELASSILRMSSARSRIRQKQERETIFGSSSK